LIKEEFMKKIIYIFALLISFLAYTNIVFAQDQSAEANKTSEQETLSEGPYTLKPGDFLRIFVFGAEELTGDFKLDASGNIEIPLIGEIYASGMNKEELKERITELLINQGYYNDPKVTIEVIAMQPFFILGEIKNPGSYEYQVDLNVFKAIAIAGGYTPRAVKNKAIIIRKINGDRIEIKATEDTPLLPGDSIKIKQRFF